jgi:hypothetical protein
VSGSHEAKRDRPSSFEVVGDKMRSREIDISLAASGRYDEVFFRIFHSGLMKLITAELKEDFVESARSTGVDRRVWYMSKHRHRKFDQFSL